MELKNDFVYLSDTDSSILKSIRYASRYNLTGEKVRGYNAEVIIIKKQAAEQLKKIQAYLKNQGYSLVIYDAYRPKRAVKHFLEWAENNDISAKRFYYPTIDKKNLISQGYISPYSNHCKGFTVDLTLMKIGSNLHKISVSERILKNGDKISFLDDGTLDMGTSFDCFHAASHHDSDLVSKEALSNRKILKDAMLKFNFSELYNEWWHYTLQGTYDAEDYDFPIE